MKAPGFHVLISPRRQRGVLTLTVSLAILVLSTLVTFSVTKAILMEQKISNNELRARQAFEAAEAGMLAAMDYINNDPDVDGNGSIDPVFDTNADGTGDTNIAAYNSGCPVQLRDACHVDEHRRRRHAKVKQRSEALTAGQHLRFVLVLTEQPQHLFQFRGSFVAERRRLHS